MVVSLFGLVVKSANKGCEALFYAFMDILSEVAAEKDIRLTVYAHIAWPRNAELPVMSRDWPNITLVISRVDLRRRTARASMMRLIENSDVCFDFTEGDSFTDMYGMRRFVYQTLVKTMAIRHCRRFVLGPQTHGPFESCVVKMWARWVYRRSFAIYSRDEDSVQVVKKLGRDDAVVVTDVAMALKPVGESMGLDGGLVNVGMNLSGLLYNGGYTGDNQFNLTVDYKAYISALVKSLSANPAYKVYLIPHVITDDYDDCENDLKICEELKSCFPSTEVIQGLDSSDKIKNAISQMDVFTGARMHATIAAFSTGVPVVPFSYSKKFEGLYGSFGYGFVINGKTMTTEDAVAKTLEYIERRDELKDAEISAFPHMKEKLSAFKQNLGAIMADNNAP